MVDPTFGLANTQPPVTDGLEKYQGDPDMKGKICYMKSSLRPME